MKNRDDQIYLEYIRKLLFDAKNAKLDREALSGETEELTDSMIRILSGISFCQNYGNRRFLCIYER